MLSCLPRSPRLLRQSSTVPGTESSSQEQWLHALTGSRNSKKSMRHPHAGCNVVAQSPRALIQAWAALETVRAQPNGLAYRSDITPMRRGLCDCYYATTM